MHDTHKFLLFHLRNDLIEHGLIQRPIKRSQRPTQPIRQLLALGKVGGQLPGEAGVALVASQLDLGADAAVAEGDVRDVEDRGQPQNGELPVPRRDAALGVDGLGDLEELPSDPRGVAMRGVWLLVVGGLRGRAAAEIGNHAPRWWWWWGKWWRW